MARSTSSLARRTRAGAAGPTTTSTTSSTSTSSTRVIRDLYTPPCLPGHAPRSTKLLLVEDPNHCHANDDSCTGRWGFVAPIMPVDTKSMTPEEFRAYRDAKDRDAEEAWAEEFFEDALVRWLRQAKEDQFAAARRLWRDVQARRKLGLLSWKLTLAWVVARWNSSDRPEVITRDEETYVNNPMTIRGRLVTRIAQLEKQRLQAVENNATEGNFAKRQTFPAGLLQQVVAKRENLRWTQAKLAKAMCRQASEIKAFEQGRLAYSESFHALLNSFLNDRL